MRINKYIAHAGVASRRKAEELIKEGASEEDIIEKRYTDMDIPENITAKQMYDELIEAIINRSSMKEEQ